VSERSILLEQAYRLFNDRQIGALLEMMTDDVEWPNVANATVLHGKDAIRSYWEAQFAVADPQVRPTDFLPAEDDLVAVVEQRILDLQGQPLVEPTIVFHCHTFANDLVCRMVVFTDREEAVTR
jgi:tellurite resistance-related uncharacterized protein